MKKVGKIIISIIVIVGILLLGLVIWTNYSSKKDAQDKSRKILTTKIANDITKYCATEEAETQIGGLVGEPICTDSTNIIKNISKITDISPFEKVMNLEFSSMVRKIELQYKKNKYIYVYKENGSEVIITDINDNSYNYEDSNNNDSDDTNNVNKGENIDKLVVDSELVKSLYNKYISYALYETNNYRNINVNDSSSDEYLVKFSIYKILEDNKINIKNYLFYNGESEESNFSKGYKITTDQIYKYIKDNFNINRTIDFKSLNFKFVVNGDDADIAYYYYPTENAYRLISDSSIPKTGAGKVIKYSKYNKHEVIGEELIVYTDFFLVVNDIGTSYINSNMDNHNMLIYEVGDTNNIEYILNKHSEKIGKFKHVFKNINGTYYWVSTQQTN